MKYEMEELMPLVAQLVKKYTSNESTSVSYDKARQLMEAILFCIEENDRNTESEALENIDVPPEQAYQYGYQLVLRKTKEALELYHSITSEFQSYGNIALYDTVIKGMPQFFSHYDALFQPQDKILTLDYPTLVSVEHLKGIDAIQQYLHYIQLEQQFLCKFQNGYIEKCLLDYHQDYEELLINVSSIVLRQTICQMGREEWEEKKKLECEQMMQWMESVLKILIREKYNGNSDLYQYLLADVNEFCVWIHACENS